MVEHNTGFAALERYFTVRAHGPLEQLFADSFGDLRSTAEPRHRLAIGRRLDRAFRVRWDGTTHSVVRADHEALYAATMAINEQAAAAGVERGLVLHGGCVEVDGRAVAFIGHSGSGKSTLTAAMVRDGHGYIADEVTAVDEDGFVQPFHRPIGMRPPGCRVLGISVPDGPFGTIYPLRVGTGWGSLSRGAALGAVMLIERGEGEPAATRLEPADALYRLTDQTLGSDGVESTLFRRLEGLVRRTPVMKLRYTTLDQAIALVRQTMTGID